MTAMIECPCHKDGDNVHHCRKPYCFYVGNLVLILLLFVPLCGGAQGVKNATQQENDQNNKHDAPMRILYIMTALAEYDNGKRATQAGFDRFQNVTVPILTEGIRSMIDGAPYNYQVDVYLILGYELRPERHDMIRQQLPSQVGLEVWDDAIPLTYDIGRPRTQDRLTETSRCLARQHRFVIKDKLLDYDFFVVFEDDMLITGKHVEYFVNMTQKLQELRDEAPEEITATPTKGLDKMFYGPMTKKQLSRMIPGFIRVEVLLNEEEYGTQSKLTLPFDLNFALESKDGTTTTMVKRHVNPHICCDVSNQTARPLLPASTTSDKLFIWETAIEALGVREMPKTSDDENSLSWVVLQRGPYNRDLAPNAMIGEYWSGTNVLEPKARPHPHHPKVINNQGGWMATRQQIIEWHTEQCEGSFLPPYDQPTFAMDGLDVFNVEYWSGGLQLAQSRRACGLQRIVSLDPDAFSHHLLYHTSNNKQRQLQGKRDRFVRADHFLGQLNAARKRAEEAKRKELEEMQR